MPKPDRLILWTGPRHSGKSTAASEIARQARDGGICVAGLLAPSVYECNRLVGFDAVDLRTGERASPASRRNEMGEGWGFMFTEHGRTLGKAALGLSAVSGAELIVVDEFGPMELAGQGWRPEVDLLLDETDAVVLLVVREELAQEVEQLYGDYACRRIAAGERGSVGQVVEMLRQRRFARQQNDKA